MPASDFGLTNIRIELDAATGASPSWDRPPFVTARLLPGSDEQLIQVMGHGHGAVSLRLLVTEAEYVALNGMLGDARSLNMAGNAQGSCLLESLTQVVRHVDGWYTCTALFRRAQPG